MRKNRISETMQNINQKYVDEATAYTGEAKAAHRSVWMKWGAIAACLCLVVATVIALPGIFGDSGNDGGLTAIENNDGTMVVGFKTDSVVDTKYTIPELGSYFCYVEVNEARKEYADREVSFLLAFDVFNADEEKMTIEELTEEYQRLADLGYKLYYVEDHWTYYGDNQKKYSPVVVGLFTEDELNNFKASEQYGYAFHFVTNGDGSSVTVTEEDVVSNFNSSMY
uniref:hypothetical protein n=1 Tax=Agathobacter sp. TaxID=2021311 RepID=UPI004055CFF6